MDSAWERAVKDGDVEAVREFVRSDANVNARDRYGQTALMLAAHRGHREIVEILIGSGADLKFGHWAATGCRFRRASSTV